VDDERALELTWTERGGPAPDRAAAPGFGTTLITRSIGHELGGTAELLFPSEGVVCRMRIPLDDEQEEEEEEAPK
jgi:two-component sensor histidine kinase